MLSATRSKRGPDLAKVDPDGHALFNANRPGDLAHAVAILAAARRPNVAR